MNVLSRQRFMAGVAAACGVAAATSRSAHGADALTPIVLAEPVHQTGYLPVYLAIDQGLFEQHGLAVSTITATGGAHVAALVSGQVWGNISGPDSDAMADTGSSNPLVAICNIVNRSNNYLVARKGLVPKSSAPADITAMMRGKKFALNRYGGASNLCGRWYIRKMGLDPATDVTIIDNSDFATTPTLLKTGVADIAITAEPQITAGVDAGIWEQPFFGFPSLGDYPYSVISVRRSTIDGDRKTVQAFTTALLEALVIATSNRAVVEAVVRKEFPTLPEPAIKAVLDRTYTDEIWSKDGIISRKGYALDMDVMVGSKLSTHNLAFDRVVDMQFVRKATATQR
jgi:NitT/TauT family transport system substrate-binding protein